MYNLSILKDHYVYSADNVSQIVNLKVINKTYLAPLFYRDFSFYLIWKLCYRSENRTMPL